MVSCGIHSDSGDCQLAMVGMVGGLRAQKSVTETWLPNLEAGLFARREVSALCQPDKVSLHKVGKSVTHTTSL